MNTFILDNQIQDFIDRHLHTSYSDLLLKGTSFSSVSTQELVQQMEAKAKCEKKLPTWYHTKRIYYPHKLNIEQTSSETTANYKANLINGTNMIDLTGGFGVDCYYFSSQFDTVIHCEIAKDLSELVAHNYKQLQVSNISTIHDNGLDYLERTGDRFDWIYVDPSRRHDHKGKVFFLRDCLPNIPTHLDLLFKHSKNVMIKTSPLLDLSVGIGELDHVKSIHIIAVNNEVKELLWILEQGFSDAILIKTINIKPGVNDLFDFHLMDEKTSESTYQKPLTYLYEPNAALLKAGGFHVISNQLAVYKLHKHTHLYTNDQLIDFPGRRFKIENVVSYNKKELKQLAIQQANITTRNFPETVAALRKKLGIKDGGAIYLFFTTDYNNHKIVLVTSKL